MRVLTVEDHEGTGRCGHCGREGLRWVATMTDGSAVGVNCARKAMGMKISTAGLSWTAKFEVIATHGDRALWRHIGGVQTRTTQGGVLMAVGGQREEWEAMGWL